MTFFTGCMRSLLCGARSRANVWEAYATGGKGKVRLAPGLNAGLEVGGGVTAVAERLGIGMAAATERDHLFGFERVALRVHNHHAALNKVRPVVADLNAYISHVAYSELV